MNTLILAAESEASATQLILPATAELVYGLIAFVVVYLVMRRFAFPALTTLLDDRREAIQGQMEAAEAARQEAADERQQYEAQLADAKGEANQIIEDAKQTAEQVRRDIVSKAESEAEATKARAQTEIEAERERLLSELRTEVGQVAVALASKIVDRELDPTAHQDLVDDYINSLSRSG